MRLSACGRWKGDWCVFVAARVTNIAADLWTKCAQISLEPMYQGPGNVWHHYLDKSVTDAAAIVVFHQTTLLCTLHALVVPSLASCSHWFQGGQAMTNYHRWWVTDLSYPIFICTKLHSRKDHTKIRANPTGFMEEFKQIQTMQGTGYVQELVRRCSLIWLREFIHGWQKDEWPLHNDTEVSTSTSFILIYFAHLCARTMEKSKFFLYALSPLWSWLNPW